MFSLSAVTCISFNSVNENFFISGSIDGKVRIWNVFDGQVVAYIDCREIVSAVCYRSDGKVGYIVVPCHGKTFILNCF